jgi:hypothetical protein
MPEDELVLGLDAGVTPPPDIAPLQGKPMPDADPSINTVFNDTSAGASQIAARMNAARRRQQRRQQERRERRRAAAIDRAAANIGNEGVAASLTTATAGGVLQWGADAAQTGTGGADPGDPTIVQGSGYDKSIGSAAGAETSDDGGEYQKPGRELTVKEGDRDELDVATGNFGGATSFFPS